MNILDFGSEVKDQGHLNSIWRTSEL